MKSMLKKILPEFAFNKLMIFRRFLKKLNPFISWKYIYLNEGTCLDITKLQTCKVLPNFLLLGAQRTGTTSMHYYLKQHPDIFMSQPLKEPGFFLDKNLMRHQSFYYVNFKSKNCWLKNSMLQGYKGEKLFGESTTYYTWGERSRKQKVPERIKQTNPKMKFIYIIRNPFDRMISHFLGVKKLPKNLEKDLKLNEFVNKNSAALRNSLYFYQLKPYFDTFQENQFKIIIFEEYISNPAKTLSEIFTHLSLKKINDFKPFIKLNHSENRYSLLENELKFTKENYQKLIKPIKKDIAKMEIVLNRSLDFWDISKEKWCL